jgi:hypothetical protein
MNIELAEPFYNPRLSPPYTCLVGDYIILSGKITSDVIHNLYEFLASSPFMLRVTKTFSIADPAKIEWESELGYKYSIEIGNAGKPLAIHKKGDLTIGDTVANLYYYLSGLREPRN